MYSKKLLSAFRLWHTSLPHDRCILVSTSIDHLEQKKKPDGVAGLVLTSRYLVESCGNHKSRLTFISQVDLRSDPVWVSIVFQLIIVPSVNVSCSHKKVCLTKILIIIPNLLNIKVEFLNLSVAC